MSNRAQSQYLRIYSGATTYLRWQSYYVGQTVTWQGSPWSYFPFVGNGLIGGSAGNDTGVSVSVPATVAAVSAIETALNENHLIELLVYEFDSRSAQNAPQSDQTLIGSFVGEVIGISGSFTLLDVALGSSLAPVGAQAPPRKYTSQLIGAPIRI